MLYLVCLTRTEVFSLVSFLTLSTTSHHMSLVWNLDEVVVKVEETVTSVFTTEMASFCFKSQ